MSQFLQPDNPGRHAAIYYDLVSIIEHHSSIIDAGHCTSDYYRQGFANILF